MKTQAKAAASLRRGLLLGSPQVVRTALRIAALTAVAARTERTSVAGSALHVWQVNTRQDLYTVFRDIYKCALGCPGLETMLLLQSRQMAAVRNTALGRVVSVWHHQTILKELLTSKCPHGVLLNIVTFLDIVIRTKYFDSQNTWTLTLFSIV